MSATNRGGERQPADFYATPAWCVERLRERLWLPRGTWLDPCAGDGAIIRAVPSVSWRAYELREECRAPLSQLISSWGVGIGDFLALSFEERPMADVILTNPPYSLALEFVEACLPIAPWVAMLLRLNFLGSQRRADFLRGQAPDVYVLPNRPSFALNGDGKLGSDSTEYAWFVWGPERGRRAGRLEVLDLTPEDVIAAHRRGLRQHFALSLPL